MLASATCDHSRPHVTKIYMNGISRHVDSSKFKPWLILIFLLLMSYGCDKASTATLRIATTTSLRDSGLQAKLIQRFTKQTGIPVETLVVGTGKAMKLGELGEVAAIITHAPQSEADFIANKHAILRYPFMENFFWIVGPKADPAQIRGKTVLTALQKIRSSQSLFVSRNDNSGTHKRETSLWRDAKIDPAGDSYLKSGQGQGPNLLMASEKQAYTLTDSATFMNMSEKLELTPWVQQDAKLRNIYSLLVINPDKNAQIQHQAALKFLNFLKSESTKKIILDHRIRETQLFKLHQPE